MNNQTSESLENKINDLQCQLAFQEQVIEELNSALSSQQSQLSQMQEKLDLLVTRIRTFNGSDIATNAEEAPPPHY